MTVSGAQQQGRSRRPDLRPEPGAPADDPAFRQRPGHGHQHARRRRSQRPGVPLTKPVDAIYDFVPATGQAGHGLRSRHRRHRELQRMPPQLGGIPGDNPESSGAGFHGGNRNDTPLLRGLPYRAAQVRPHRSRRSTRRTLTFTSEHLRASMAAPSATCPTTSTRSTWASSWRRRTTTTPASLYNETLFPQDIRNCTKCHDGSADLDGQDRAGRQLEERAQPAGLRRLPRRHQLRHRHRA